MIFPQPGTPTGIVASGERLGFFHNLEFALHATYPNKQKGKEGGEEYVRHCFY